MSAKTIIESGKAILGIEFGSTRIKAVLIDTDNNPIAQGSFEWENQLVDGLWTYSIDTIWKGLQDCYADLRKNVKAEYDCEIKQLAAIGISAMMHGYMAFGKDENILVPFRTWRNTNTAKAAAELSELFHFNIPLRWSISHVYQAILNGEDHINKINFLTTLAGYIHWQLLYGGETVKIVDGHSKDMVDGLNNSGIIPIKVVYKGTANSSAEVEAVMKAANNDEKCVGIITWMHTFSPAKMWIKGLQALEKPLLHFHTQYNAELPWDSIDMDFMNLNQSAHGDIEFGHICTRMRIPRKVVVGYWKSEEAQKQIATWARVAAGVADAHNVRCLMFGMNMNNVAVTDGDRVEFEQRLGYHVDYYPVSSLMEYYKKVTDAEADALVEEYKKEYTIKIDESGEEVYWEKVKNAAKAEIALRRVLKDENAVAFTTNFDDLGDADIDDPNFCGFDQIPGLASQRLMTEGYGFGAEGDWKTACLYRTLWVMNQGLEKGCSFLEDYTLNFAADRTSSLQSHMLEVCPLIATDKPKLEVHFLGIGIRKQQTARLVFTSKTGKGVKATVVDLGNRFRLIASEVECIEPKAMPKLPVASALWVPQPTFEIGAGAWILAGGTHHSAFSYDITAEYWEDFCEILGIEFVNIDKNTTISSFKQQLRNNEIYYMLNKALR